MTDHLTADAVFQALDATWPAARMLDSGPVRLRDGKGGGQRVSAATVLPGHTVGDKDIIRAEHDMHAFDQRPLFMVRPGEDDLDQRLAARDYAIVDPVVIYVIRPEHIARKAHVTQAIEAWPPLAAQCDIWAEGGIGPARIDVMARAECPRTTFLGRSGNSPAATVYVGAHQGIAMLHALETRPAHRRNGLGRRLVLNVAHWAMEHGANWLTLAVTRANAPANALYSAVGMTPFTHYHYRRAEESAG